MSTSNGHYNGHASDEQIDSLYSFWPTPQPTPQPLLEAAFSITLKGKLGGQEALLTARGMSPAEFKANLQAITGLLDPPQSTPPVVSQGQDVRWCRAHQVALQENHKAGRTWFSHRLPEGGFCKGK
jgi:hypothetical protein